MDIPRVASRDEWLAARKDLLAQEKQASHAKEVLDAARRSLPMVEIDKEYFFAGPEGQAGLPDLFERRRQLIVYHFIWRYAGSGFPGEDQGCPTCSVIADNIGHLAHLHACQRFFYILARRTGMSATNGALSQLRAATDPAAKGGEFHGPRFVNSGPPVRKPVLRKIGMDTAIAALWEVSERETGLPIDVQPAGQERSSRW